MRKKLMIFGILLVVALGAVWGGSAIYAKIGNEQAPDQLSLSSPTPGATPAGTMAAAELSGTWNISDGSQAGYRVKEVLNGQDVTVVGRTGAVSGQATIDGTSLVAATAVVDMGNVTTDNSSRDSQFQGILKTSEFPTSTFALTSPVDIGAVAGGAATTEATGQLSIAGVTRDVKVALNVQTTADGVEVQGTIPVTFSDYGVDAPNLGFVKVENSGAVEMLLKLKK
ncbi:hypothetical protein AS189_12140 [Arthrobacter alpinus]|uniref:Lipid/polyisoprenoid-binding YceI-like domain-containing protein n=1 Tax=Arthrobacter alpinus TaxID=656366 RepID=A0A0S2LZW1_9MICC|nr:YceI family protein [Arthrobacter alpinus]ALO67114.1 hypothetical protein AS189_12140 [Arthrobacter alpinus]